MHLETVKKKTAGVFLHILNETNIFLFSPIWKFLSENADKVLISFTTLSFDFFLVSKIKLRQIMYEEIPAIHNFLL